jgi:hypothetical protein
VGTQGPWNGTDSSASFKHDESVLFQLLFLFAFAKKDKNAILFKKNFLVEFIMFVSVRFQRERGICLRVTS